jgi:hypothetical protein
MGKLSYLVLSILLFTPVSSYALVNGDFETGDLSGWTVSLSLYGGPSVSIVSPGTALWTNGGLNMVHSGKYAAMLYSGVNDSYHADWARIEQAVTVPPGQNMLEMWFAAVINFNHFSGGVYGDDTYVLFEVLDPVGGTIYSQRFSSFDNAAALIDDTPGDDWKYLPWQQITVPLSSYENQTLTVRYTAYDCNFGGHFSYGYIDDLRFVIPPSPTPTFTVSPTITETHTITPTFSVTDTYTVTPTCTPSYTATPTFTPTYTNTFTATITPTTTPTFTPTFTNTPVPFVFKIKGSFPNPSVYNSHIVYYLSRDAHVTMQVFDVSGEKVRYNEMQGYGGYNEWFWDSRNRNVKPVASGVFIIKGTAVDPIYGGKYIDWCKAAIAK